MGYKMKSSPAKFWPWGKKKVTKDIYDNPDIESKRTVRTSKRGTTTKEIGYQKPEFSYSAPSGYHGLSPHLQELSKTNPKELERLGYGTHTPRSTWEYGEGENKKNISARRFKSKVDKKGVETRRKEQIVYADDAGGEHQKKVKQRKVKFGKNKGKILHKTVHWIDGKKTVTKKYLDEIDTSPIKKKKKYGL